MNAAYLILGGNIGNRLENINKARDFIREQIGAITKKSDIFVTAAWGNTEQPDFYNQAICVKTALKPIELLNALLAIENEMGRVRSEKWAARTIDLDILFYNDEVIDLPELQIPHPHIPERRFVLVPLNEIAGKLLHPVLKKSISELTSECRDHSEVRMLIIGSRQ